MTDDELNLALAEELKAITTASEENFMRALEASISAELMIVEPPESASAVIIIKLVLQKVEPEATQPYAEDFSIIDEFASKVSFVKRWTQNCRLGKARRQKGNIILWFPVALFA